MHKKKPINKRIILFYSVMFFMSAMLFLLVTETQSPQQTKSHASGDCTVTSDKLQISSQEQALFDQLNAYRLSKGVGAVAWSSVLKKPAAWLSNDMNISQNLSHTDSLGRTPNIRVADCGYTPTTYAETIAYGPQNAASILTAWKGSVDHNAIILDGSYTEAAIAMVVTSNGNAYWTVDFGISGSPTPLPTATMNPATTTQPSIAPSDTPVPTEKPQPSPTPGPTDKPAPTEFPTPTTGPLTADMQVQVKVKISGIGTGGNIYPKHKTRHVTVLVYDTNFAPVAQGSGFPIYDGFNAFSGVIHLGKMNQGVYFIKIVSDETLQQLVKPELQLLKVTAVNQLPAVTLYLGDITADNILSIDDYNLALACFQDHHCQVQNFLDFNDDGLSDITDYNVLLRSFAQLQGN